MCLPRDQNYEYSRIMKILFAFAVVMQNHCEYECELRIFVTNANIFVIRADPYPENADRENADLG
jgi:hypothetical protein